MTDTKQPDPQAVQLQTALATETPPDLTLLNTDNTTPPPADDCTENQTTSRMVPISEAIRFRKRAQAAEQQLTETQQQLQTSNTQLNQAEKTISQLEQRQTIDAVLTSANVVDMEVARILVESSIDKAEQIDLKDPSAARASIGLAIGSAVESLRHNKPYLFRQAGDAQGAAMAMRQATGLRGAENAAEAAAVSGNRQDLLRYLRLRRGA